MSVFVTFEISKKLKEKGFKEKVYGYYDGKERFFNVHPALNMNDSDYRASAPTISQVLKWLREEKKIHIGVLYHDYYAVWIQPMKRNEAEHVIHDCKTHEGAELEGIEFVLDNLI